MWAGRISYNIRWTNFDIIEKLIKNIFKMTGMKLLKLEQAKQILKFTTPKAIN
jgi:hypothetical protein